MCRVIAFALAFAVASAAHAQTILGGSNILTTADVVKLGGWLGEGPLEITNIHSAASFDPLAFHAAADNKGRTFTVARATVTSTGVEYIVGGYTDDSWYSQGAYHYDFDPAGRTNFIFNLTTGRKLDQQGATAVYDDAHQMPSWGSGHDLCFGTIGLGTSFALLFNGGGHYGPAAGTNIFGEATGVGTLFTWSQLETFTIAPDAVPEPASLVILGLGISALRRRGSSAR